MPKKHRQPAQTKTLTFPAFFPDATYASISHVPLYLLEHALKGIVITTLHAHAHGLDSLLQETNQTFKEFANLPEDTIVLSDSGGFQVLSLIHNKRLGKVTQEHAMFHYPKDGQRIPLSPELSQEIQHKLGTDIRVVLDYPIMGHETLKTAKKSVEITIQWAKRAKKHFLKLLGLTPATFTKTTFKWTPNKTADSPAIQFHRPLLTAVVQGGNDKKLRQECATELKKIGFDIYGFGGWPLKDNKLNTDLLEHFLTIIPTDAVAYAMGLGTPDDIATLVQMGYHLFDCTIPSRNARHGTIFVTKGLGEQAGKTYDVLHIKSARYTYDQKPLDPTCTCPVCQKYSRAYIRFLQKTKNPVGATLASIHNIYWYTKFTDSLKMYKFAIPAAPLTTNPTNSAISGSNPQKPQQAQSQLPLSTQKGTHANAKPQILEIYHDATCKVANAHIKGHSGKGPATCGFYIKLQGAKDILLSKTQKISDSITIPEAEFRCFLLALAAAAQLLKNHPNIRQIVTYTDSQLLANWINQTYRIKKPHIKTLYEKFLEISKQLAQRGVTIQVKWHRRSSQTAQLADKLANLSAKQND